MTFENKKKAELIVYLLINTEKFLIIYVHKYGRFGGISF